MHRCKLGTKDINRRIQQRLLPPLLAHTERFDCACTQTRFAQAADAGNQASHTDRSECQSVARRLKGDAESSHRQAGRIDTPAALLADLDVVIGGGPGDVDGDKHLRGFEGGPPGFRVNPVGNGNAAFAMLLTAHHQRGIEHHKHRQQVA